MKTGVYIMMFALLLTGCNDFLKETSQDEVRPSTVSDLEQILVEQAGQTVEEADRKSVV